MCCSRNWWLSVVGIGGLGHLAIKFLQKLGAFTAAFTTTEKKVQSIKDLGADEVVVSTKEEEMKKVQGKYDLILYTVPSVDQFEKYLATVNKKGTMVLLGVGENNDIKFNYFPLLKKEIKVVGSLVGPRGAIKEMVRLCSDKEIAIKEMVRLCSDKEIYPICEEYDFDDLPKAFDKLENGKPHFRCVLNVKNYAEKHGILHLKYYKKNYFL